MTTPAETLRDEITHFVNLLDIVETEIGWERIGELQQELEQKLSALLLAQQQSLLKRIDTEVIGEDKVVYEHNKPDSLPISINMTENYNNALRAEQRKVLARIKAELGEVK